MMHIVKNSMLIRAGLAVLLYIAPVTAHAQSGQAPTIEAGAIEVGVDAAMTTTEGISNGSVILRGGFFCRALRGLGGVELAGAYRHVSSLDATDLEALVSWQKRFRHTGNYPFVSMGGGLRREDIGSFSQTLYPLGFSVGIRSLLGQRGGFRVEYRFRRIFNDPSADYSEHHVTVGLSVYFRNPSPGAGSN
ncbi:MAG: hypothetical protein KAT30_09100 [Candidatus Krumholzibacteria bacterium]|nr:hypothetical protein [Candidatus Krumholzibacteria bacterium]